MTSTAVYGCKSKDNEVRMTSSSGGIFTVIAEKIISCGGVVYGTAMSEDCKSACFVRVDSLENINILRGSKYLQSKVGNAYIQAKKDLDNGIWVLFSGCPCQVNGFKLFLGKEYDNLLCVDIICHGVPSPKLWRLYAEAFEKEYCATIKQVNFRCKNISWRDFGLQHETDRGQSFSSKTDNPYLQLFLKNYVLRPSCYECNSKSFRKADISIGDFWGVENVLPGLSDSKGTSLVILRSDKGELFFEAVKDNIEFEKCEYEAAVKKNIADYKSVTRPSQRDTFFEDMNRMSFKKLRRKYLKSKTIMKLKRCIKKFVRWSYKNGNKSRK